MQNIQQLVLDENNIAFHPMIGNSYKINDTAHLILKHLKQGKDLPSIIKKLAQTYQVSEHDAYIDIHDFLSKLKAYGLL